MRHPKVRREGRKTTLFFYAALYGNRRLGFTYKPTLHKNLICRKNFFSQRIINDWNNLPAEVVNVKTISQFKKELDSHWIKDQERYRVLKAKA